MFMACRECNHERTPYSLFFEKWVEWFLDFLDFLSDINNGKIGSDTFKPEILQICDNIFLNSIYSKGSFTEIFNFTNNNIDQTIKEQNRTLINNIKTRIENDTKGIYTYLKISNFEHSPPKDKINNSPFNERFDIKINTDQRSMTMESSNINMAFYTKIQNAVALNGKNLAQNSRDKTGKKRVVLKGELINEIKTITYDNKFVFGNFNQIFEPAFNNQQIADHRTMDVLVDKIKNGNPVFIMGWGASGSGKTSTLINFTKKDSKGQIVSQDPGILIHVCNRLAKDGYTKAVLSCVEMFKPSYLPSNADDIYENQSDDSILTKSQDFTFNYDGTRFNLQENVSYTSRHLYRQLINTPEAVVPIKDFNQNDDIGTVMQYIIDDDRLVKATPNNPMSSRSHVLCYLKFSKENSDAKDKSDAKENSNTEANLIFGDLAGVENPFNCVNSNVISKFMNVNRYGTTSRFYEKEIVGNKFDVLYGNYDDKIQSNFTFNEQNDEKTRFTELMKKPFFNFNNDNNLLTLYDDNIKEPFVYQPATAITKYVNLILSRIPGIESIPGGLNNENLNG
jgi:hypothetical protein